ncbi:type II secretion system protein [Chengkuizengella axinellae]|uniref:Prepilin-type N-terminal cleavage/methylation domain-containing protein n=1 Tax=Chengkuizengella axinellae TaxID=3064388 RepID=A0ABT9IZD8_9BACL|nr:prepilin-type N-terminal cleavage/methylation domain-containing protein [Chengkuizengella sp. 2205SS18-9]MDP5274744.1 prepilin-type N-terminal cleavage/methylation domain-containing protein [Chengkuizengella sp. 2205SS18-9]
MIKVHRLIYKQDGITLIELLMIVVILGVLAAISVPKITDLLQQTAESVCEYSRHEFESKYTKQLQTEHFEHSEMLFSQFLVNYELKMCPHEDVYAYLNGEVVCSEHLDQDSGGGEDGVPHL